MGIIYWICFPIRKADSTPSFKVGNFNFLETAAALEGRIVDRSDGVSDAH